MIVNVIVTLILALLVAMNFVQSAKMAHKANWSPLAYRIATVFDATFAVLCTIAIFFIWTV